jgi:uncharacterized protein (TIGR02270 family)
VTVSSSLRRFYVELYEEHLEEAGALYEQRIAYLHDPELTWLDLDSHEQRIDAHVDALVVGARLALEVCQARCTAGDFGQLYAAMRVFCRQDRPDIAFPVLQNIDHGDEQAVRAVIDALQADVPETWFEDLGRIMLTRSKELVPILASVLAYRRVPVEEVVVRALAQCSGNEVPRVLWALGRIGGERSRQALVNHLRGDSEAAAESACRALIRLGDYQALRHGLLVAQMKRWPVLALGIGGNRSAVNVLSDLANSDRVDGDVLIALGLLGDVRSVNTIIGCLSNSKCATSAAIALQTITGAALYGRVFVPDEVDPDEFSVEERERYERTGEVPTRADGKPYGVNVTQISADPDKWRAWLTANKSRFDPELRYRHGKPCTPLAVIECLQYELTPNRVRALMCEELVVRYRAEVALEIDMPVRDQQRQLNGIAQWAQRNREKFKPGGWYFAGRQIE